MKLVNPIGRSVTKLETGANLEEIQPRACVCSSGSSATYIPSPGCGCQCGSGSTNLNANYNAAKG